MSSIEALKVFINERLTAAAGEIFTVFQQTIVRYEEEIDRQRKLMTNGGKPRLPINKAEAPEQHDCVEEQLFQHQGDSRPEPEGVEPSQIKEEHEELCTGEEGDQLPLGMESSAFIMAFTNQPSDFAQPEAEPEQPPSLDSAAVNRCDLKRDGCEMNAALETGTGSEDESPLWPQPTESHMARRSSETCCLAFGKRQPLLPHQRCGAGKKKDSCKICRETFSTHAELLVHMRSHTDEKPYSCQVCGKRFGVHRNLLVHMRTHTGEKPYSCAMCGRSFSKHSNLLRHIRTHTGEKPFPCTLCDKSFRQQSHLLRHTRTHRE